MDREALGRNYNDRVQIVVEMNVIYSTWEMCDI